MSAFTRFIGGSPFEVLVKLLVLSFIVGIVLNALNIHPLDIFSGIQGLVAHIYNLGFKSIEWAFHYLLLGAAIVLPVWLVLRILNIMRK